MLMTLRKSILWFGLPLAGGLLVMAFVFMLATPSSAPAKPSVQWTPSSIDETILAGETKTVPVAFTASADLTNVVVRVVPELEPYVQADPAVIGNVSKGQTVNLDIIVSAQASSLPGSFDGTIQLGQGMGPGKTFARPLSVILNIVWQSFTSTEGTYRLVFPGSITLQEVSDESLVGLSPADSVRQPGDVGYPGPVQIRFYENAENQTLEEYFNGEFGPDLFTGTLEIREIQVDGELAFLFRNVHGLISSDVVVVPVGINYVVLTRLEMRDTDLIPFDDILQNMKIL